MVWKAQTNSTKQQRVDAGRLVGRVVGGETNFGAGLQCEAEGRSGMGITSGFLV